MRVLLVADDTPANRVLVRQLEANGIAVSAVTRRSQVNGHVRAGGFDVLLLDQTMEGKETTALLRFWRHGGLHVSVLVLVAPGGVEDGIRYLDLGADAYVTRPLDVGELLAYLRALLRRSAPAPDPVLRVHDLEIDRMARAVRRAGRPVRLTPREYTLLEALARNPGRAVSRSALMQQFSQHPPSAVSNVIDVYVRYLRNKVDRGFSFPLILTCRGEGYMLRGDAKESVAGH